ncbi:MAG: hypothetical protein RL033_6313 [Pseudomonadota bacterium]
MVELTATGRSTSAQEVFAQEASEARSPAPPGQEFVERGEALLRAASLLLARDDSSSAAHALHGALARELGCPLPAAYTSRQQAEEVHRQLGAALAQQRARVRPAWSRTLRSRRLLARSLPQWLAWAGTCAILAFLGLRYSYAVYARARWAGEHPDGAWISRYYGTASFQDLLVTRYDVGVDYVWGKEGPAEAMARDNWSARWDTCLVVKRPLQVSLLFTADDTGKLWIAEQLLSTIRRPASNTVPVELQPGIYPLRLDYTERRRHAEVSIKGLDFNGNDTYSFVRPRLDGEQIHCDPPR